jgi:hypothetical protein
LRATLVSVANETGVTINVAPPKVDAPPRAPEDVVIPATGFFRPTSNTANGVLNTTVTGSLSNIMRFFNRINYSPVLMVIGTVKLEDASTGASTGQSGSGPETAVATTAGGPNRIRATFSVTPYLLAAGQGVKLGAATTAPAAGGPPDGPPGGQSPGSRPSD